MQYITTNPLSYKILFLSIEKKRARKLDFLDKL